MSTLKSETSHSESFMRLEHQPDNKTAYVSSSLATLGGIIAAFSVASCCALPLLFASFGVGTAWLTGIAFAAVPYRDPLLILSGLALSGGAVLLWRQQRAAMTCGPNGVCVPPVVRLLNLVGLLIGAVLLWAGYKYV